MRSGMSYRSLAGCICAVLIAGCQSSAPSSTSTSPKNGGTLVVGIPGDLDNSDSATISDSISEFIDTQVMEGLVGIKPGTTSDVIPVLAAQMPTISSDGTTYTFQLRQNVKFGDGTPFNADAVKYNYDRWANLPKSLQDLAFIYGAIFGGFGADSNIASVAAQSPSTIVITLRKPQSNFLLTQTLPMMGIASPTALKAGDADNPDFSKSTYAHGGATALTGTGPFKFKEWVPGDHLTLVKNGAYWDAANAAHVDKIVFQKQSDQTAMLNALQSGQLDLITSVTAQNAKIVAGINSLKLLPRTGSCIVGYYAMQTQQPPFDNVDVRRAVAYALNRKGYLDSLFLGVGEVADNFIAPLTIKYAKPLHFPAYDPGKAKELLAKAGMTAENLKIDLWYPSGVSRPYMPDPKALAEAIRTDLEAVGFTVTLKTEPWRPDYLGEYGSAFVKFQSYIFGTICDWATIDNFIQTFHFAYVNGKPFQNGLKDDLLNQTMIDAANAKTDTEAAALWGKAQDLLFNDMPEVPLINVSPPAAAQKYVQGFVPTGLQLEELNTVWLNK